MKQIQEPPKEVIKKVLTTRRCKYCSKYYTEWIQVKTRICKSCLSKLRGLIHRR